VREIHRVKVWFEGELQEMGVKAFASGGNFLLANFGAGGPRLFQQLEREGVLLRDRSKDLGAGFVRITIGTQAEMKLLLKKIKRLGFSADTRP